MGKGSSGAGNRSGGGKGKAVTSITTQGGVTLDLSSTPLIYGDRDASVSDAQRARLEAQEAKHLKSKIEYGYMVGPDGKPYGAEIRGGSGSVRTPFDWWTHADAVFTHNHPRGKGEENMLGGTFSEADAKSWALKRIRTIRASAAEGTYSMSKEKNFDALGFTEYYARIQSAARAKELAAKRALGSYTTKMSWPEFKRAQDNCFNVFLVECHNGLLAGQKQYGYTYTLEGRNG